MNTYIQMSALESSKAKISKDQMMSSVSIRVVDLILTSSAMNANN